MTDIEGSINKKITSEIVNRDEWFELMGIIKRDHERTKRERDFLKKRTEAMETEIHDLGKQIDNLVLQKQTTDFPEEKLTALSFSMDEKRNILGRAIQGLRGNYQQFKKRSENISNEIQTQLNNALMQLKETKEQFREIPVNTENYTIKTNVIDSKTLNSERFEFMDTVGEGMINQILIQSDTTAYSIRILIDDELFYDRAYSYFNTNSEYLENTSAFLDAGIYHLSLRNLSFQKKFQIIITSTSSVVYSQIYIKYEIRKEQKVIR